MPTYFKFTGTENKDGVWLEVNPKVNSSLSYGDFEEIKGTAPEDLSKVYIIPNLLSGGVYDNSTGVERSNHRVFLKQFKNTEGVHSLYGGFGTFAIAIRADVAESNKEIKEILDNLEDYPVIDSDDLSVLENELYLEAWDQWANHDVTKDIKEILEPYMKEETIDEIENLKEYFQQTRYDDKTDFCIEAGGSVWFNREEVAKITADLILLNHFKDDLPLLIGYKWHTQDSKREFEQKMKGTPCLPH